MLQKFLFAFLLIAFGAGSGTNTVVMAQSDEAFPVQKSTLTESNLPSGAMRLREASIPLEMRQTLAKLVAAGGDEIRQGDSEVLLWMGDDYKKAASTQLTKKLETALQASGWTYEIGEQKDGFVLFTLYRTSPERRALIGFFAPADEAYIFAVTEMLRADVPITKAENQTEEKPANNKEIGNSAMFRKGENSDRTSRIKSLDLIW